jgi:hypothetical protein
MKHLYLAWATLTLSAAAFTSQAQTTTGGVRIGTAGAPNASAVLDLSPDAATAPKGLLPPRLTLTQRNNIGSPATGLVVYQTDNVPGLYVYNGSIWVLQGDNLGNHTATQSLNLGANKLVGNGGSQGLSITNIGGLLGSSTITASSDLITDANQSNTGTLSGGLQLGGSSSGEGLASKRNAGGNQFGLDFYTSALNRLSITGTGNVGIGTDTPGQLLELGGQNAPTLLLHSSGNNLVNGAMLQFRENDLGYGWNLRHNSGGSEGGSTNDRLVLESTNNGPAATVMSWDQGSGNVSVANDLNVSGNVGLNYFQDYVDQTLPGHSRGYFTIGCPSGYRLLSGGGGHRDYNSAQVDITVNYSGPDSSNPTQVWEVLANNDSGSSRTLRIWCTCAKVQ